MMDANVNVGKRVKDVRKALNMTQEEFANEIGVGSAQISRLECGAKGTTLARLEKICEKFDVSMDYFMLPDASNSELKDKWIKDIFVDLRGMSTFQVGMVKRFVEGMKG